MLYSDNWLSKLKTDKLTIDKLITNIQYLLYGKQIDNQHTYVMQIDNLYMRKLKSNKTVKNYISGHNWL